MTVARTLILALLLVAIGAPVAAESPPAAIGVVVMHGKGGSPAKHVAELATGLERKGYLVANLEMPWSGARNYDAPVAAAESEVEAALAELRAKGAARLFIAGHSQGGLFALWFGGRHPLDGIIAIAPGGNVASPTYREKLGDSVSRARQLIAAGTSANGFVQIFNTYADTEGTNSIGIDADGFDDVEGNAGTVAATFNVTLSAASGLPGEFDRPGSARS